MESDSPILSDSNGRGGMDVSGYQMDKKNQVDKLLVHRPLEVGDMSSETPEIDESGTPELGGNRWVDGCHYCLGLDGFSRTVSLTTISSQWISYVQ